MRKVKVNLTGEEAEFLKNGGKTILVRPKEEFFESLQKGDKLLFDELELLILDIRDYPRLEDLLKIEPLEWITTNQPDMVAAIRAYSERFKEAKMGGREFVAIEFAVQ